ncbi:putative Myb-like transcription factor [Chloropicon primus]|nr:putative Myb-like transcription factor [Chloropicon primus]UPR04791.1 putative Myb-like transcription factor [Chloropicon primus]|mmetsp:Transcript_19760/g.41722  ORF Transcript_19760/g.41722 Transcript_19760/m.41722 type:complete len:315 (+) Transcript_19760:507-1451(+)|eukprot:QDZ25594.1 putative Myb-like transcription factor [Chloropicon primus]
MVPTAENNANASVAPAAKSPAKERKKAGVPWTPEEHKRFLMGLSALGKGDWRGISRHYVQTRTPTQVASHAQKYFIRQTSTGNKRKRRTSLFDTTLDTVHQQQSTCPAADPLPNNGSNSSLATLDARERNDQSVQPSVSPKSESQHHLSSSNSAGSLPMGIMPVGILANQDQEEINPLQQMAMFLPPPAGMFGLGCFPSVDPGGMMMMMNSMMQQQQASDAAPPPDQQQVQVHVLKPTAVRYTSKEVQKFKKEWNGSFTNQPASGEEVLRTHIATVYKATKKPNTKTGNAKTVAAQSLSNGNSSSSQTTLLLNT